MNHGSTLATLLICLGLTGVAAAGDWTEFRGPTGQGLSTESGLPTHWGGLRNLAWQIELPGKGWSSPILFEKHLYLTSAVPAGSGEGVRQSLRAICLDASSGKTIWNVELFEQPAGAPMHTKNSHASPTPVTDGKRLFVHFGPHGTASLALKDGEVLWRNEELKYSPVHGNGGSPALVDGAVVVSCDGSDAQFVAALEQDTGKLRWRTPRNFNPIKGFSFSTPLAIEVDGSQQIVSAGSAGVAAYEPGDGHEIWRVTYPGGYSVVPRPVYGLGLLFVCIGYDDPGVMAIKPEGAAGDVTATHVAWRLKKGAPLNPSPLLVDDSLYLVSDDGRATCVDAETGKQRWQHRLQGNFSASPVYADGKIFFQSEEGDGFVVKPGRSFHELAKNDFGERTLASYAIGDGALFIRGEKHLARIEEK
jgi:outer membrane protein assembly factor BamB